MAAQICIASPGVERRLGADVRRVVDVEAEPVADRVRVVPLDLRRRRRVVAPQDAEVDEVLEASFKAKQDAKEAHRLMSGEIFFLLRETCLKRTPGKTKIA